MTDTRKRGRKRDPNKEPRRRKTLEFVESVAAQLEAQADAAGLSDSLYVSRLVAMDAERVRLLSAGTFVKGGEPGKGGWNRG